MPSDTARDRMLAAALGLTSVALSVLLGWLVVLGSSATAVCGPLAGLVAVLACRRWLDAAVVAAGGVALGATLLSVLGTLVIPAGDFIVQLLPAIGVAAVVAGLSGALVEQRPGLVRWLAPLAVVVVIGGTWILNLQAATVERGDGLTAIEVMNADRPMGPDSLDEALYLRYIDGVRRGRPYYETVRDTLLESNVKRRSAIDAGTPLSYRLPTLYVALAAVAPSGLPLVIAGLAMSTISIAGVFALAGRFVSAPLAVVGACAGAAYVSGLESALATESWAGAFVVLSAALLCARGTRSGRTWMIAAVVAALVAALIREMAVAYLVTGLIATVADPDARRERHWVAWLIALIAAGVAYGAHWSAAARVAATATSPVAAGIWSWLDLSAIGLPSVLGRITRTLGLMRPLGWGIAALAVAGAVVLPARTRERVFLGAATIGALVVLTFVHPAGPIFDGMTQNYWMDLTAPVILACVTLGLALPFGRLGRAPEAREDAAGPADAGTPEPLA